MLINNKGLNDFNAALSSKNISLSGFNVEQIAENYLEDIEPNEVVKKRVVDVELIFSNGYDSNLKNMSNLIKESKNCIIQFEDIKGFFKSKLINHSEDKSTKGSISKLKLVFSSIFYENEIIENLNRVNSKTINVAGNLNTPAIVEIIPSIDMIDLVINGLSDDPIIIKNLKDGQKVILNGEDSTILENGINKFDDTDMWEFPRLVPGSNAVKLSKNSCEVTIKYKSRWI